MTRINKYLATFGVLVLVLLVGFLGFIDKMKSANLVVPRVVEEGTNGNIIIVLTGGSGRIAAGLALLKDNPQNVMIISGVNENAGMSSIFANYDLGDLKGRIYLEKDSKSTFQNAEEAVEMVETLSVLRGVTVEHITLVTSPYHMYRASYTFKKIFPENISILNHPSGNVKDFENSWSDDGGLFAVFKEYIKMSAYYLKLSFR